MSLKKNLMIMVLGAFVATSSVAVMAEHHGGGGKKHPGKMMEKMFEKSDKNSDGVISKSEFLAQAEERFAKMDADGNGEITKDEIKAHHEEKRKKRQDMKDKKADESQ